MTPAEIRALADKREDAAIAEGLEQMAKGWKPDEIVAVLADAAGPIAELREQAVTAQARIIQARAEKRIARLTCLPSLRGVL